MFPTRPRRASSCTVAEPGEISASIHPLGLLAQLAEHRTFNPLVQGSSPWWPTTPIALACGALTEQPGAWSCGSVVTVSFFVV